MTCSSRCTLCQASTKPSAACAGTASRSAARWHREASGTRLGTRALCESCRRGRDRLRAGPRACYIAVHDDTMLGFACYDVTCRNFFGPGRREQRMNAGAASAARCCWPRCTRNARRATRTRLSVAWVRPSSTQRPWARCRSPIPRRESTQRCCGRARRRDGERELPGPYTLSVTFDPAQLSPFLGSSLRRAAALHRARAGWRVTVLARPFRQGICRMDRGTAGADGIAIGAGTTLHEVAHASCRSTCRLW